MLNYKNKSFSLFTIALLATIGLSSPDRVDAKLTSNSTTKKVKTDRQQLVTESLDYLMSNDFSLNSNNNQIVAESIASDRSRNYFAKNREEDRVIIISQASKPESVFNLDGSAFEGFNTNAGGTKTKIVRIVSISFFLLLFVPFGIFYPFFLFYRRLLNVDGNYDGLSDESTPVADFAGSSSKLPVASFDPETLPVSEESKNIYATVSKLQIAFPADSDIRKELEQLCSSVDPRTDSGVVELMRKTIALLIERDDFTHLSCSSQSLEVNRVKEEFEVIVDREASKFKSEELSLVGAGDLLSKPSNLVERETNSYVVVTLVLCTSHTEPLYGEITTKKQLTETLVQLSKMRQDNLIKFDLLWNPDRADRFISDRELLLKYIDTIRLF